MRCADLSAGEPLAGTATVAGRFLLVEHRGRWGRDPLDDETALPAPARATARAFDGRTVLVRRPDRRSGPLAAMAARVDHGGGALLPADLPGHDELVTPGPLVLVCAHGRRDRCCAQRGAPLFDALLPHLDASSLWLSSHHGGHRFAANVLVLPWGVQLGRVEAAEAARVAALLLDRRIPLERFRGRTLDPPRMQAADVAVRRHLGIDGVADVRPLSDDGLTVELETPAGVVPVKVEEQDGPMLPMSCGAESEPTRRLVAHVE